jgi:hypothetical protein
LATAFGMTPSWRIKMPIAGKPGIGAQFELWIFS